MSFTKKGNSFPQYRRRSGSDGSGGRPPHQVKFAAEIALALEKMLRGGMIRIKTVASWTGANERTVKNWVSGRYGPCGAHLIMLMQHSDEVIESVLSMVGLDDLRLAEELVLLEKHMQELALMIRSLKKAIER
jgi:hypothetical protein